MSANPELAPSYDEVRRQSGVKDWPQYSHIAFTLVAWNEEERLPALLRRVRPFFRQVIVGVQKSTDRTLEIAHDWADRVVEDDHLGYGDATYWRLLDSVTSKWSFKLDADEWPSEDLLYSLSNATWWAERHNADGVWIPFRSAVEGQEYNVDHSHLRLFETDLGWPATLHSRPPSHADVLWPTGYIRHDRSLDEMVQDYLRYLVIGQNNEGWVRHNTDQILNACMAVAHAKGWGFVKGHAWWPQVGALFEKEGHGAVVAEDHAGADPVSPRPERRTGVRQGTARTRRAGKVSDRQDPAQGSDQAPVEDHRTRRGRG